MTIEIKNIGGKWYINGKTFMECTLTEQRYFVEFINAMKCED